MRILTKLKFRFRTPDKAETFTSQGQNLIEDAPDWIEKDPLFPLVVADGTLIKLDNEPVISAAEPIGFKPAGKPEEKPAPKKAVPKKTAAKKK